MTLCALYMRVSSDGQRERNTVGSQRTILPKVAESHGLKVFKEYVDDGISGESIEARPAFQALLEDASAGYFGAVVVIDFDRLTRATDLTQLALIKRIFREANIKVITPTQVFDLKDADQDFVSDLLGVFSKFEKRKILARSRRGIKEKMRQGKWIMGRLPTPYFRDGNGVVRVDPGKEKVIRSILDDAKSVGRAEIAARYGLKEKGIAVILEWRRLLCYAGFIEIDGEMIRGEWPAICTLEEASEVRSAVGRRRYSLGRKNKVHLLTGLGIFRCGKCGRAVTSETKNSFRPPRDSDVPRQYSTNYYRCGNKSCPSGSKLTPARRVEQIIIDNLNHYIQRVDLLVNFAMVAEQNRPQNREIDAIDARIAEEEMRKRNLVSAISGGVMDFEDAREKMDEIKRNLVHLQIARGRLTAESRKALSVDQLSGLNETDLNMLSFDDRREMIRLCLSKITLSEGYLIVEYRFIVSENGETRDRVKL